MRALKESGTGSEGRYERMALAGLAAAFAVLAVLFVVPMWGEAPPAENVPLVDAKFLDMAPTRQTYADLMAAKEDLSDFDCYACHEKDKPPPLRFDENNRLIIPKEHANIEMAHGTHDRNNLCYNCHNEANLLTLQRRDGKELKLEDSVPLCGSCHGPTYRDWEAGAHGRTSGFWNLKLATATTQRLACANCHDPHSPAIRSREPAPGPHTLHGLGLGTQPGTSTNRH